MIGVPGTAQRLFGALREDGISVILISQGSSEHSICFADPRCGSRAHGADRAARVRRGAPAGQIQNVDVVRGCSILSVVGDGMAGTPGIAAQVFGALGAAGVNIRAIAQGSSERNISVVIDERQTHARAAVGARRVLSVAAHDLDRPHRTGRRRQRAARSARVAGARGCTRDFHIDLRLRGVMTIRRDGALRFSDPA